jgi:predicted nuclease of predicted toxin-antitoxin system
VIKLASDENFDGDVVRGLIRRVPQLDLVRIQDADLAGSSDPTILAWSANENRVLLTHDRDTMPKFVYDRVIAGEPMPGVFLVSNRMPKGQAGGGGRWACG